MKLLSAIVVVMSLGELRGDERCNGCSSFFRINTVCGFDGVTYKNQCYAKCNNSHGVKHFGACKETHQPCDCPDVYAPVYDI